jgi:hypothetical protein
MSGEWLKASLRLPLQNGLKGKIYVKIIKQQLVFFHSLAQKKKEEQLGYFFLRSLSLSLTPESLLFVHRKIRKSEKRLHSTINLAFCYERH